MASKHHFAGPQMGSTKETCLPIPHPPPHPIKTLHSKDLWAVIHAKEHNIIILIHKMHPFNLDFCGVDRQERDDHILFIDCLSTAGSPQICL